MAGRLAAAAVARLGRARLPGAVGSALHVCRMAPALSAERVGHWSAPALCRPASRRVPPPPLPRARRTKPIAAATTALAGLLKMPVVQVEDELVLEPATAQPRSAAPKPTDAGDGTFTLASLTDSGDVDPWALTVTNESPVPVYFRVDYGRCVRSTARPRASDGLLNLRPAAGCLREGGPGVPPGASRRLRLTSTRWRAATCTGSSPASRRSSACASRPPTSNYLSTRRSLRPRQKRRWWRRPRTARRPSTSRAATLTCPGAWCFAPR